MRLLGLFISVLICLEASAQQPASPAAASAPPPAAPGLTPTEMNALMNTLAETEAKNKQQPNPQPAPQPAPAAEPAQASPPPQAPAPAPTPLPQGASMNPPPSAAPAFQPPSANTGSGNTNNNNNVLGNRNKSPFMIPTELYNRVKQMQTVKTSPSEGTVDSQVEVRRRWPLRDYTLVAVMWGVSSPKAMIADRENKLHVFRVKDYIANSEGYISEITNGEVIVIERGAEIKLKLKSR